MFILISVKNQIYKDCHLQKPDILQLIDYLNESMNLNLDYDIYNEKELLDKLEDVLE